jgi:hypothetical protein
MPVGGEMGEVGLPGRALMAMPSALAEINDHDVGMTHRRESPWMRDEFARRNSAPDAAL